MDPTLRDEEPPLRRAGHFFTQPAVATPRCSSYQRPVLHVGYDLPTGLERAATSANTIRFHRVGVSRRPEVARRIACPIASRSQIRSSIQLSRIGREASTPGGAVMCL